MLTLQGTEAGEASNRIQSERLENNMQLATTNMTDIRNGLQAVTQLVHTLMPRAPNFLRQQ